MPDSRTGDNREPFPLQRQRVKGTNGVPWAQRGLVLGGGMGQLLPSCLLLMPPWAEPQVSEWGSPEAQGSGSAGTEKEKSGVHQGEMGRRGNEPTKMGYKRLSKDGISQVKKLQSARAQGPPRKPQNVALERGSTGEPSSGDSCHRATWVKKKKAVLLPFSNLPERKGKSKE